MGTKNGTVMQRHREAASGGSMEMAVPMMQPNVTTTIFISTTTILLHMRIREEQRLCGAEEREIMYKNMWARKRKKERKKRKRKH